MRSPNTRPPLSGTQLQMRMHLQAFVIAAVVDTALVLALGFTVLADANSAIASLSGLGIGIVGLCTGYGIALLRFFKETR